jgi:hypothetical protein
LQQQDTNIICINHTTQISENSNDGYLQEWSLGVQRESSAQGGGSLKPLLML